MAQKKKKYNFISVPDAILTCRFCKDLVKEPKQCLSCNKLLCSDCVDQIGKEPCPHCSTKKPKFLLDLKNGRDVQNLGVKCSNEGNGCTWRGILSSVEQHLDGCEFAMVSCPNRCTADKNGKRLQIQRKDLDEHTRLKCPNRSYSCQLCQAKGTYTYITKDHEIDCNKKIVACTNVDAGCLLFLPRNQMKDHLRMHCEYSTVICEYESLGCQKMMQRKELKKHMLEDRENHMTLALNSVRIREEQHRTLTEGEAIVFKVSKYGNLEAIEEKFYSEPFYTHPGGYKMCIQVSVSKDKDTKTRQLSVFSQLLMGQNDMYLPWPFLGAIKCELLNQLADNHHHSKMITFDDTDNAYVGKRKGYSKFLPLSSLAYDIISKTHYLIDDSLYFRVSVKVDSYSSWLVCTDKIDLESIRSNNFSKMLKPGESIVFKVTGYYAKKAANDWFYSEPFYTGPGGYKMCVNVVPSGYGSGKGKHISIYARLLKGAYDSSLTWPFVGSVTFTLLNQSKDSGHHSETVKSDSLNRAIGSIWGSSQFVSFSELSPYFDKDIKFLQNDKLFFRVSVQVDCHKPWLACTYQN